MVKDERFNKRKKVSIKEKRFNENWFCKKWFDKISGGQFGQLTSKQDS
ncbi:MAG TPA: hypothetical protein HA306_00760 [Methanosarcina sp.]|nr:hypothetical protein [Methanosarcina sp.]